MYLGLTAAILDACVAFSAHASDMACHIVAINSGIDASGYDVGEEARGDITDASFNQDFWSFVTYNAADHFDRPCGAVTDAEVYTDSWKALVAGFNLMRTRETEMHEALQAGNYPQARKLMGQIAHAVQDFYAHSNMFPRDSSIPSLTPAEFNAIQAALADASLVELNESPPMINGVPITNLILGSVDGDASIVDFNDALGTCSCPGNFRHCDVNNDNNGDCSSSSQPEDNVQHESEDRIKELVKRTHDFTQQQTGKDDGGDMWNNFLPSDKPPPPPGPPGQPGDPGSQAGPGPPSSSSADFQLETITPGDPNGKVGPRGSGASAAVARTQGMSYVVFFENKSSASAAAREVRVVDKLDTATVDVRSFSFSGLTVGAQVIALGSQRRTGSLTVALDSTSTVSLGISWSLDDGGLFLCDLQCIDPATGLPPADPVAGFLPPNQTAPEGEGAVMFNVGLRSDIPDRARVENLATIVFDTNAPIVTNVVTNTVDAEPPESAAHVAGASQLATDISVTWGGTDYVAGIMDYDVYVKADSLAPVRWLRQTTARQGVFSGKAGHTYGFFSVARDSVGNVEAAPAVPDATIRIDVPTDALASVASVEATPGVVRISWTVSPSLGARLRAVRRIGDDAWIGLKDVLADGEHRVSLEDSTVVPGRMYSYGLVSAVGPARSVSGIVQVQVPAAARFALFGVRPNPTGGTFNVELSLLRGQDARVEVFDVQGRRVQMMRLQAVGPGPRSAAFGVGGSRLRSGVYFVVLQEGSMKAKQRFVVTN